MIHVNFSENSSGVCIYYKSNLSVMEVNFDDCRFEECWCIIKLSTTEKLLLGAIYHSPSSSCVNTNRLNDVIHRAVDYC